MRCHFIGVSKVTYDYAKGATSSQHVTTDVRLEISNNLDNHVYLNKGMPTKDAMKPFTQCFIQGIVANIHKAHAEGWWDSADHLRYVIQELERGFASVANVSEGTM